MSKHILALSLAGAAVASLPAWAGPVTLVSRELDVFAEAACSGRAPVVDARSATGNGTDRRSAEALIPNLGSTVDNPFRPPAGFISAQADSVSGLGVGANAIQLGTVTRGNPPNVFTATAFERQVFTNTSTSTTGILGTFTIPAPTVTVLLFGNPVPPPDPRLPRAVAFAEITTVLTRVNGDRVNTIPTFLYGIDTFYDVLTADLVPIVIGSAPGIRSTVGPNGQLTFSVPALENSLFALGAVAPGETLEVKGRYFAQIGNGTGETGASAFVGDPNNLSASAARFTLETADVAGPVDPPPGPMPDPTAIPAPAGWTVLAAGLAALGMIRGTRRRG